MKNICAAFVKAQRDFAPALKTNTNPHFRSKYVGLDGCIEAVIDSLNGNGIALLQPTHECADGVTVETLFIHESGETMSGGKFHVPAAKNDPQGYGSALTYARRYSLMAACGIAPEDDDGNAASKPQKPAKAEAVKPVHKPTDGAGDGLSTEEREAMEEIALYLVECHKGGNDLDAIRVWYDPKTFANNDQRVYVWSLLGSESKLRSTIKANQPPKEAA
jgi:hypothetical protein